MADAELLTRITLQNQEFQNEIRRCKREINDLKKSAKNSTNSISSMIGSLGKIAGISLSIGAVANGIKDLASASIEAYRKNEMLITSFSTLLGSATQAQTLVNSLKQYGADSPYDTEGLSKAAQLMLGYGMRLQQIMPTLKQLGDIAMGDNNKLQSLALAFSQMSAAGKVCKQDLNQMVNAGFNPLQIISEQTGESIGDLTDKVSRGQISVRQIEQAFKDATSEGGKFHNMAANMSNTLEGRINSMADEWANVKTQLGGLIAPSFIAGLQLLTNTLKGITELLGGTSSQDNVFNNKTKNAIEYARNKGNKGKTTKEKNQLYRKTINRGIDFEQKQLDKELDEFDKVGTQLYNLRHPKGTKNWKLNNTGKYQEKQLVARQKQLAHSRTQRLQRIDEYKSALTDTPYVNTVAETPISTNRGGGRTNKGGGHTPTKEEVIPEGSLKALEKQLKEAQEAASLAVGEQAYQTAMATVKKIEDAIDNFKWGGAEPNTAKNVSEIGKLDKNGGLVTDQPNLKLPTIDELKPLGDIIKQDQIDRINELAEALKNANGVFDSYGGNTVGLQKQIVELAQAYKTTGDATSLAGAGMALVGQQMQALGEDGAAAKAGAMMAAIGQIVLGFASASKLAGELGPIGWVAWLGAGLAALATTISTVQSFSQGGIINGGSVAGDHMLARVNAGEMILNGSQQQKLFNTLNSNGAIGGFSGGEVDFKISGSALKGVLRNYDNKTSIL